MKIEILIVRDGGVFVELLGRLSPAHYVLRYAEDLRAARRLHAAHQPRLVVVSADHIEELSPLLIEVRSTGVLILCLATDTTPAPMELVDAVAPRQDIDHAIRIVGLLLEERRRFPRAEVELPVTLAETGEMAMATVASPQALFVPREQLPSDGEEIALSIASSDGDLRCAATVARTGLGESGRQGMALAIPENARQMRALLDDLVRRTLMTGHLQHALGPDALPAELTREVTRRIQELSSRGRIGRPDEKTTASAQASPSPARASQQQEESERRGVDQVASQLHEIEAALMELRAGFDSLNQAVEKRLIQQATVQQEDHQALQLKLVMLEEQLSSEIAARAHQLQERREELQAFSDELEQQRAKLAQQVTAERAHHQALQQELVTQQERLFAASTAYAQQLREARDATESLLKVIQQRLAQQTATQQEDHQALQRELVAQQEQLAAESATRAQQLQEGRDGLELVGEELRQHLASLTQQASEQQRDRRALEQKLEALQQQLAAESATRAQQLQEGRDDLGVLADAVEQRLAQQTKEGRDGLGTLADAIEQRAAQLSSAQREDHEALQSRLSALEEQLGAEIAARAVQLSERRQELSVIREELEQQLTSLAQQATAERADHQAQQQELRAQQEQLASESAAFTQQLQEARKGIEGTGAELRKRLASLTEQASEQQRDHRALEQKLVTLQEQLAAESATRAQQSKEGREDLGSLAHAIEQSLAQQVAAQQQEHQDLQRKLAAQQQQLENLLARATNQEEDLQASQQRWRALEEQAEKEYQSSTEQRGRLDTATADMQRRLTSLDVLQNSASKTVRALEQRLDEIVQQQETAASEAKENRERIDGALKAQGGRLDSLAEERNQLEERLGAIVQQQETAASEAKKNRERIDGALKTQGSRLDSLAEERRELEKRLGAIVQRQETEASEAKKTRERIEHLLDDHTSRLDRVTEGLARFATMHTEGLRQIEAKITGLEKRAQLASSERAASVAAADPGSDSLASEQLQRLGDVEQQIGALRDELPALRSEIAALSTELPVHRPVQEIEEARLVELHIRPRRWPYVAAAIAVLVAGALGVLLFLRLREGRLVAAAEDASPGSVDARDGTSWIVAVAHDAAAEAPDLPSDATTAPSEASGGHALLVSDAATGPTDAASDDASLKPRRLSSRDRRRLARHLRHAKSLTKQGKHRGARRHLMRALSIRDDQRIRILLARNHLSTGDISSAILHQQKAIEWKGSPDLYDGLGMLHLKQKRKDLACEAFRSALDREPSHRSATRHLRRYCL